MTELHEEAFAQGVTTQLGRSYWHRYYRAMIAGPDSCLWVAELDGNVVAFLGTTKNRHQFESVNRSGKTRLLATWRLSTARSAARSERRSLILGLGERVPAGVSGTDTPRA